MLLEGFAVASVCLHVVAEWSANMFREVVTVNFSTSTQLTFGRRVTPYEPDPAQGLVPKGGLLFTIISFALGSCFGSL